MENVTETPILSPKGTFPATVVKVIDDYKLVINRGEISGIREGQRMLVYNTSEEEIKDPQTKKKYRFYNRIEPIIKDLDCWSCCLKNKKLRPI